MTYCLQDKTCHKELIKKLRQLITAARTPKLNFLVKIRASKDIIHNQTTSSGKEYFILYSLNFARRKINNWRPMATCNKIARGPSFTIYTKIQAEDKLLESFILNEKNILTHFIWEFGIKPKLVIITNSWYQYFLIRKTKFILEAWNIYSATSRYKIILFLREICILIYLHKGTRSKCKYYFSFHYPINFKYFKFWKKYSINIKYKFIIWINFCNKLKLIKTNIKWLSKRLFTFSFLVINNTFYYLFINEIYLIIYWL